MAQQPAPNAVDTPFRADPTDELPVSIQLGWRLRALIVTGRLAPRERLPSVRTLAGWAGVNVNTVRGVYARLEDEGLIATRQGAGTFVSESAGGSPDVERVAAEALAAASEAGVDPREVAIATLVAAGLPAIADEDAGPGERDTAAAERELEDAIEPAELDLEDLAAELDLSDDWLEADDLSARRELRRQIGRLEAQLASYRRDLPPAARRVRPNEPRIAGVAELERVRDTLLSQLATARATAARRAGRERRAREVRDAMVADPAQHRWEVVSSGEAGEEGCRQWEVGPRFGPLGALMSWWRVRVSGGCP